MMTSMRIDDELKKDCEAVFDDLGISMTGAVTLFLQQVRKQRAIPFVLSCDPQPIWRGAGVSRGRLGSITSARWAIPGLRERGRVAERYFEEMREANDREWTLDEINAEITASRRERHARAGV